MFDSQQTRRTALSIMPPVITMAASSVGVVLGFGLCGVGSLAPGTKGNIASIGLFLFGLSLVGILVGTVWFVVVLIVNSTRR